MMQFVTNPMFLVTLFLVSMVIGVIWGLKKSKDDGKMQVNAGVVAVGLAVVAGMLFSLPTLSIDIEGIFTYAFDIVNAFMPLIAIVAGLGLGFNLVTKIGALFQRAL